MKSVYTTLKVYLLLIGVFFLLRAALLVNSFDKLGIDYSQSQVGQAFVMGLRFDTVIACYILLLPFIVLFAASFTRKQTLIGSVVKNVLKILIGIALFISVVDIPYFDQFFSRLSVVALTWIDSPSFVFWMIVGEPKYLVFIAVFLVLLMVIYKLLDYIFRAYQRNEKETISLFSKIATPILVIAIMFLGIRGRLAQKSPIRVGTAYFSTNPFLNQLGLNPNFTFLKSYLDSRNNNDKPARFKPDNQAFDFLKGYYPIIENEDELRIEREIVSENNSTKYNIVVVLMESMSAKLMSRHGSNENLTPFLDSLSNQGYYFDNNYSAGIHTFNGIYSTLFSYPGVFKHHPMKAVDILNHNGIVKTLKKNDYHTLYFTTHDGQFDNIEGFLRANNFDEVISQQDYPSDKVVSAMGVPDDYLFDYTVTKLNEVCKQKQPFFATILTGSNHEPYHVPAFFKSPFKSIKKKVVQYADYSLRKFISTASKEAWFANTIFVFVGDHGAVIDPVYEAPLSYNHVPLLFYAPHIIKQPKALEDISLQIDIMPTVMGLLNISYTNNTLGIDLFKQKRPYGYFNADDKFGVIDKNWYLIVREDKSLGLYQYQTKSTVNLANEYPSKVDSMRNYAESSMQAYEYLRGKKKM